MNWQNMSKDDKITELSKHIKEGRSLKYISKVYHTTRGAIQGFTHRNNIKLASPYVRQTTPKHKPRYRRGTRGINNMPRVINQPYRPPDSRAVNPCAFDPLPGSRPVVLMERDGCCWPVGAEMVQLFCNQGCKGAYCTEHQGMRQRYAI